MKKYKQICYLKITTNLAKLRINTVKVCFYILQTEILITWRSKTLSQLTCKYSNLSKFKIAAHTLYTGNNLSLLPTLDCSHRKTISSYNRIKRPFGTKLAFYEIDILHTQCHISVNTVLVFLLCRSKQSISIEWMCKYLCP